MRRMDFAVFMVAAIENDELVHEAPAIVGCQTPSALAVRTGILILFIPPTKMIPAVQFAHYNKLADRAWANQAES